MHLPRDELPRDKNTCTLFVRDKLSCDKLSRDKYLRYRLGTLK